MSLAPNDNSVIYDRFAIESAKRILMIQNAKDEKCNAKKKKNATM